MQSVIQLMATEALNLKQLLSNLMEYSSIVRWNYSKIIMAGAGDYQWEDLNDHGRQAQARLLSAYSRFANLVRFLTMDLPRDQQQILALAAHKVFAVINQNGFLVKMNKEELYHCAINAIDRQYHALAAAYAVTDDVCLIIPDSRVLLANPELEKWQFTAVEEFKILLLPEVLAELDKTSGNDHAKNKIKNSILEYTKSKNIKGTELNTKNVIQFVSNLPKSEDGLPWLDINGSEDKMIAAYFAIVRTNPHTQAVLVTNNPVLKEKALLASAICGDPPLRSPAVQPVDKAAAESGPAQKKTLDDMPLKPAPPAMQPKNEKPAKGKPARGITPATPPEHKPLMVTLPPTIPQIPVTGHGKPKGPKVRAPKLKQDIFNPNSRTFPQKEAKAPLIKTK